MDRTTHRRTDPACREFAGRGRVHWILGVRIPSLRRIRYDRGRGFACPTCSPRSHPAYYFGGGDRTT